MINQEESKYIKYPFADFFKGCNPKVFFLLFKKEQPQTIAFILSFCKKKSYIKKVINIFLDENYNQNFIEVIIKYLKRCKSDFDSWITRDIEKHCLKRLLNYKSGVDGEYFRKNIKIKVKTKENSSKVVKDTV
jgi:flagellar motor switch protein FliG